ncbi:MAG: flagellar motor switch protein FliN [Fimbriimonadaceae bacterium]
MNNTEIITALSDAQAQIWGTVSSVFSEACEKMITMADPLTLEASSSSMGNEFSAPMLILQFSLFDDPDQVSVILIPSDVFADLASEIKNVKIEEVDDNTVVDCRPQLEAIVQGLCLGVGNVRNEPVVASNISIRHQVFALPANLQRSDLIARTQVALSVGSVSGTIVWLTDEDTARAILGLEAEVEEAGPSVSPFLQVESGRAGEMSSAAFDDGGLGMLYDIPLEISVELGRVRMMVREVLDLGVGSLVEIDKAAGEPVDVMVNGRLVAKGEVVVIEDNFGVRITEIVSAMERLTRLGEAA